MATPSTSTEALPSSQESLADPDDIAGPQFGVDRYWIYRDVAQVDPRRLAPSDKADIAD